MNIGKWTSSNKATNITGQLHGPWIPIEQVGNNGHSSIWAVRCSKCGFEPSPMTKDNLRRAEREHQEKCRNCPKEPK